MPEGSRSSIRTVFAALSAVILLASGTPSLAQDFTPAPDKVNWKTKRSELECRLSLAIPYFGEARFLQRAGESSRFQLRSHEAIHSGEAQLRAETPAWRVAAEPVSLGVVPVKAGSVPVDLGSDYSEKILSVLFEGLYAVFGEIPANSLSGKLSVGLAAVNFRPAYGDYRDCQSALLPLSFSQVQRTRISFGSGGFELNDVMRSQLDVLLRHVALAANVKAVFVDGYTDDSGRRSKNLELSRMRAEAVSSYLVSKGIDSAIVTTRYHGSRYPVARGRSESARAQNRRVTVRLERG